MPGSGSLRPDATGEELLFLFGVNALPAQVAATPAARHSPPHRRPPQQLYQVLSDLLGTA